MVDKVEENPSFLEITKDAFNAYHLTIKRESLDHQFLKFVHDLEAREIQLNKQREIEGETTAIWIHLTHPKLHLSAELVEKGYAIHSGEGKSINLNKWIARRDNLIPAFSVFYIACGAVLIKDECIFLVQERTGDRKGKFNLPSGRANPGETIAECVERELWEETKIRAKFKYIINFRESSQSMYNSVDIYFPCYLQLEENGLEGMQICERELKGYQWVPLSEYLQFTKQHSNHTQVVIAEHISRVWKDGFKFQKDIPNLAVFGTEKIRGTEEYRKFIFHELVTKKQ